MGGKDYVLAQVGRNFRLMTVVENTVSLQADFTEAVGHRRLAAGSGDTAYRIDHRPLLSIQKSTFKQWF